MSVPMDGTVPIILGRKTWSLPEFNVRTMMKVILLVQQIQRVDFGKLTQENLELVYEIAFIAINRADATITREQFEELPIALSEIIEAMPQIARQAGMKAPEVGEARADQPTTSTGTPS